jgi:hypothetical protein
MGMAMSLSTSAGTMQVAKTVDDAFSQALRWLHGKGDSIDVCPVSDAQIIQEAGEFLLHCKDYVDIADMHMMYDRALLDISVDEGPRTVRFQTPRGTLKEDTNLHGFMENVAAANKWKDNHMEQVLSDWQVAEPFFAGIKHQLSQGRIIILDTGCLMRAELQTAARSFFPPENYGLPDDSDLSGFTLGDFKVFWTAMISWSLCASYKHRTLASRRLPLETCMPTQVVDRHFFMQSMANITGISSAKVDALISRLAYGNNVSNPNAFLQPLLGGERTIAWSPHSILKSRYERNMLKLMSRIKSLQPTASTLIGSRELPLLREIGQLLAKRGYAYKLKRKFSCEGQQAEIDLLAYNSKCAEEILVVEAKAVLGPDEVNEIASITNELSEAQGQVQRAINILQKMTVCERQRLYPFVNWVRAQKYYPVIVTPQAYPDARFDHSIVPAISFESIKQRMRRRDSDRPSRFWQACIEKKWFQVEHGHRQEVYKNIQIGNVTYQIPTSIRQT